jgi:hypothetical protein
MTQFSGDLAGGGSSTATSKRFGYYAAIFTAVITIVTFGFAITAVPISGAYCLEDCIEYPYLDTASQYPKDFLWMPLAILLVLAYVALMVAIHTTTPGQKKIFSQVGLSFALIAATLLASDYFVQFTVIPVSLRNNETEGLAMLIQYNPHGVFIALEELGYLLMSLSFLFVAPVFAARNRLEIAIRWVFLGAFILTALALGWTSIRYGLDREYRFEVIVISINWLVLIINGILLSLVFRKQMNE